MESLGNSPLLLVLEITGSYFSGPGFYLILELLLYIPPPPHKLFFNLNQSNCFLQIWKETYLINISVNCLQKQFSCLFCALHWDRYQVPEESQPTGRSQFLTALCHSPVRFLSCHSHVLYFMKTLNCFGFTFNIQFLILHCPICYK